MTLAKTVEATKKLMTAEELWQLSDSSKKYELVRGELVEVTPPGGKHGNIALEIGSLLLSYVRLNNLGVVMVETGFRLESDPDTVRGPDVSFLSTARIPSGGLPDGYISGTPDLAVEVVSPSDTATEVQDKVQDYLAHGAQRVWVVYPQQRVVVVHHPDGTARTLRETDSLEGESVVPGFACPVKEIFGQS